MSWGKLRLRTASHGVVFEGEASPAPGGGSIPVQASYSSAGLTTIADGASSGLPWDNLDDGADLLDRTDPTLPLLLADGAYAIVAQVFASAPLTAGGYVLIQPELSPVSGSSVAGTAESAHPDQVAGAVCAFVGKAGDTVYVAVTNHDGAASRDFGFGVALVKLA